MSEAGRGTLQKNDDAPSNVNVTSHRAHDPPRRRPVCPSHVPYPLQRAFGSERTSACPLTPSPPLTGHLAVRAVVPLRQQRLPHLAEQPLQQAGAVVGAVDAAHQLRPEPAARRQALAQRPLPPHVAALTEQALLAKICTQRTDDDVTT